MWEQGKIFSFTAEGVTCKECISLITDQEKKATSFMGAWLDTWETEPDKPVFIYNPTYKFVPK